MKPAHKGTTLAEAKKAYGREFGTNGKTTKGITFWTADRVAKLSAENAALRIARDCK
jgi:hypothetical protein